ncbi:hypothetical protein BDR26DRAFT_604314 [Obelidium mucronatum]|nr:hypothetical protein BDR26DRAFT_604314 [Obelidium mucronatum]
MLSAIFTTVLVFSAGFAQAQQSASDITVPYVAPIFPDVNSVPIGSYVCNGNKVLLRVRHQLFVKSRYLAMLVASDCSCIRFSHFWLPLSIPI